MTQKIDVKIHLSKLVFFLSILCSVFSLLIPLDKHKGASDYPIYYRFYAQSKPTSSSNHFYCFVQQGEH